MTIPFLSLGQTFSVYKIEEDWLFEKLLLKLNENRHLLLSADRGWGLNEYVNELGYKLSEKNPDMHVCYLDIRQAHSPDSFLEHFLTSLANKFPDVISGMSLDSRNLDTLKLPALIAKSKKIRLAVFMANSHLLHQYHYPATFLRMLKLKLRNQKDCVCCLYGNDNQHFRDLIYFPGPLSGLGQPMVLKHIQSNYRSASIRKLFHDHNKSIGYHISVQMSCLMDNHPFYLQLLAWHALIRTRHRCTEAIVEEALNDLIHHFSHRFGRIAESLTTKQLRFLKALVEGNQKPYSKATREEYQLGSSSNIARIKQSFERMEMISTNYGEYKISDPVFREWLRRYYFHQSGE